MKLSRQSTMRCLVFVTSAAIAAAASTRIINGTVVEHASALHAMFALPTQSADSDKWLGCGASIISPTFALTSAHCFGGGKSPCSGPSKIALWIGDVELDPLTSLITDKNGGKCNPAETRCFRVVADLICNPAFDGKCSHGNDVALLKFQEPLPNWVKPVALDLDGAAAAKVGDVVTPMGFGLIEDSEHRTAVSFTNAQYLRKVDVTVLAQDSDNCKKVYKGGYGCSDPASEGTAENVDMQVCAGSPAEPDRDACAGDSGSPVVDASGIQVALVSYGGGPGETMEGPGRMCGDPDWPGVYARVSSFRDFITQNVGDLPSLPRSISPHNLRGKDA